MKIFHSSTTASHHKVLGKLLIAGSVFSIALSAAMPTLAETRSCDWTLSVGTSNKNMTVKMQGKSSGSAKTVFFARKAAEERVINCFDRAFKDTTKVPVCQLVDGWNQSVATMLPAASNRYILELKINSQSGLGCNNGLTAHVRK